MSDDGLGQFISDADIWKDVHAVLKCAGIGNRGPGSDYIQVIPHHIG